MQLVRTFRFSGDRDFVRDRSAKMALTMLRFHLWENRFPSEVALTPSPLYSHSSFPKLPLTLTLSPEYGGEGTKSSLPTWQSAAYPLPPLAEITLASEPFPSLNADSNCLQNIHLRHNMPPAAHRFPARALLLPRQVPSPTRRIP